MKKYILLTLSLITLFINTGIVNAEMISPKIMTADVDTKKSLLMTDEEQEERIKIVYFYHDFWYKNMYLLFNKYVLPEYDKDVVYEDLEYLASKDSTYTNNGISKALVEQMHSSSHEKFLKAYNYLMSTNGDIFQNSFTRLARQYVSGDIDILYNHGYKFSKIDAEKKFKELLYISFKNTFDIDYIGNNGKYTCDWFGLDIFVRGNNKDYIKPLDETSQTYRCIATYTNPDLDKFKNSFKEFLTGNNSYFNPVSVEVDPDYGNYINNYKIKDNLSILVDKVLKLPAGYENNKKPSVKLATTWGINVQEKYPSIYETNNVIFNPYTGELNDYIVGFGDYFGDLVYVKYGPFNLPMQFPIRTSDLFFNRILQKGINRNISSKYLSPIYSKTNTLSSKPFYYSTYNGTKINVSTILNSQDNNVPYSNTSTNNTSNTSSTTNTTTSTSTIGTPNFTYTITLGGKEYSATKYNGIYFRTKDDLYNYYYNNLLKPFLSKSNMSEADFWKDSDYKASLILKNFTNRNLTNARRIEIVNKLNNNFLLLKHIIDKDKAKFDNDPVRYKNYYMTLLEVFYIINYQSNLLNWNENTDYIEFKKYLK